MRERKPVVAKPSRKAATAPKFNVVRLQKIADELKSGRLNLPSGRTDVTDEMQPGLRASVFKTGNWSYIVEYKVKGHLGRPHITIGEHPVMSISEARELARIIRHLGSIGINPQEGLRERLVAELKRDGIQWRGGMAPKP